MEMISGLGHLAVRDNLEFGSYRTAHGVISSPPHAIKKPGPKGALLLIGGSRLLSGQELPSFLLRDL